MASCQTSQWGNSSPYVKLIVSQGSSDGDSVVLEWELQYIASSAANTSVAKEYTVKLGGSTVKSGTYDIDGKTGTKTIASGTKTINKTKAAQTISFSVSFGFNLTWSGTYKGTLSASGSIAVAAKTSYTVKYNANGGSGAPSSQTKWYGETLTLSSTKPTRTGYSFQGWATSASGSKAYNAGASYTANAAVTLYAVWKANTYTVTYNANGGTGAPANQTKTYGTDLTLSSTKPKRTNYNFVGWGTSASATTVSYAAGAKYTKNAAITLYAIWELAYIKPQISNLRAFRCDSSGNVTDTGEYAIVSFDWKTFIDVTSILIEWFSQNSEVKSLAVDITALSDKKSGTVSTIISNGNLDANTTYTIRVTVTDNESQNRTATLGAQTFPIDACQNLAVAIGKAAEILQDSNGNVIPVFDVKWLSRLRNHLCIGEKTGHLDGKTGILLSYEGYIHLQRTTAQNYNPYIAFLRDNETAVTTQIQLDVDTNKLKLLGAGGYEIGGATNIAGNLMLGNKTGYQDGKTGVYINKAGYMHLQRASSDGNPYIGFYLENDTTSSGNIVLKHADNNMYFEYANQYRFDSHLFTEGSMCIGYGTNGLTQTYLGSYWKDGAHHFLVEKASDGLTSAFGWAGSSSYATITRIRGRTCQYQNSSGTTALSDERLKKDFTALDKWGAFFDALEPCAFKMKAGTSGRYHLGFKAQQVEKALTDSGLTTQDFAGFVKMPYAVDQDDPERSAVYEAAGIKEGEDEYGLIYSEFTALNTYKIQQLQKENNELKSKVTELEERLAKLEALLCS